MLKPIGCLFPLFVESQVPYTRYVFQISQPPYPRLSLTSGPKHPISLPAPPGSPPLPAGPLSPRPAPPCWMGLGQKLIAPDLIYSMAGLKTSFRFIQPFYTLDSILAETLRSPRTRPAPCPLFASGGIPGNAGREASCEATRLPSRAWNPNCGLPGPLNGCLA